jgi:hypothetical protein
MPQQEVRILHYATPLAAQCSPLISEPDRTVTLPFLTQIDITAERAPKNTGEFEGSRV